MLFYMFLDVPRPHQIGFQDPATPVMEGIIDLHHNIYFYLIILVTLVFYLLDQVLTKFHHFWEQPDGPDVSDNQAAVRMKIRNRYLDYSSLSHWTFLEIIWTLAPSIVLVYIAIPSFALLYSMEEAVNHTVTIKVIGHQWYWSYEYSDYGTGNEYINDFYFDSYMVPETDLRFGDFRLLEVDNPVYVPTNVHLRFLITSTDVLHSWAIPSLGVKVDAVPGRLNQVSVFLKREGTFYGQCSEICGVNHGFMPIVIKGISVEEYLRFLIWISKED